MDTDMKATYEQQELALKLAVQMLSEFEPGDSRAVSNEFVALAAVECELVDDKVMDCIKAALN